MHGIIIFITVLGCILVGDLLTGYLLTLAYNGNAMQQVVNIDQKYLFYFIVALLITIVFNILKKRKKTV
ncbi:MAG: hypothetical protein ABS882_02705 [Lysinibacillus sp.]